MVNGGATSAFVTGRLARARLGFCSATIASEGTIAETMMGSVPSVRDGTKADAGMTMAIAMSHAGTAKRRDTVWRLRRSSRIASRRSESWDRRAMHTVASDALR